MTGTPDTLVEIVGTGRYLPERCVTNHDLSETMDTSDEWIRTRTGIGARRLAADGEFASHMAAEAGRAAMEEAGVGPEDIDILILTTATPDRWLPSTACDTQELLGLDRALAFDLHAACTGFLYALSMAEGYLVAGRGDTALVISTERMSSIVDWNDRTTSVLFGDGAGAAVVRRSDGSGRGIVSSYLRSDGRLAELLYRPAGGNVTPMDDRVLASGDHLVRMAGREIFKSAVRSMAEASEQALERAGLEVGEIALMVPHQANVRIIESTAKYAGIPMDKVFVNLDKYGNMSSASIPVALDEAREQGRVPEGGYVLSAAFGAGLTWGAMVWRF